MRGVDYPKQIRYQRIRPKGYLSHYKEWPIDPMSSNQYWGPNQIIRFLLNMTEGVMDPYRSYLVIDLAPSPNMTVGCVQLDSSAQSLFSQLVITSDNRQVQRIPQYDTLAAYLADTGMSQWVTPGRDIQGLGIGRPFVYQQNRPSRNGSMSTAIVDSGNQLGVPSNVTYALEVGTSTSNPLRSYIQPAMTCVQDYGASVLRLGANMGGQSGANLSFTNPYMTMPMNYFTQTQSQAFGGLAGVRADYAIPFSDPKYPDSNQTILKSGFVLTPGSAANTPNPNNYSIQQTQNVITQTSNTNFASFSSPNTPPHWGYQTPYSSYTAVGCNQPILTNTIPTCSMQNGNILPTKQIVPYRRFMIPILSSLIGALIPPQSYQLIPLQALRNLLIELTLSPYAVFSSGYPDRNQFDSNGMMIPIPRAYRVVRIQYVMNIYTFYEESVRRYISETLTKGIVSTNQAWTLGAQYQIPTGSQVRGSWPINSTVQSLSQLVVLFLSNQYNTYPFCRKQFRLSNNITSFQLKFNTDYYPPQPITGNGGNPEILDATLDNSEYYTMLLKSNNSIFTGDALDRINRVNFSINGRIYDPTSQLTLFNPLLQIQRGASMAWSTNQYINMDTAMGMPFFHQNRYVGRGAYSFSFEPYAHSKQYMMGVDTRQARPFQILLSTAAQGQFQKDQTMYVFLRYNIVVSYTKAGISVIGK